MSKIGFSFGSPSIITRLELLSTLLALSDAAIEIGFVDLDRLKTGLSEEEIYYLREFKYISLHAPAISIDRLRGEKRQVLYSKANANYVIELILKICNQLEIDTVLFHPDTVQDFQWLNAEFGEILAFENMDKKKAFGKTLSDMRKVYDLCPHAKWVCDVNHLFTIDQSMELSKYFHRDLEERLCHYHVSAYGGFHATFSDYPDDKIILNGIKNASVPIIHEGGAVKKDLDYLRNEYVLLNSLLP